MELNNFVKKAEYPFTFNKKFREYGIKVIDGGNSIIKINYCPFTGKKLPSSLRDEWFNKLEVMGYDDPVFQDIPEEFNTELWWLEDKDL